MLFTKNRNLIQEKLARLKQILSKTGSLLVAFSGGVDSTCLLHASFEVLGGKVIAVTAFSAARPQEEAERAERFCRERGITHIMFPSRELLIKEVVCNDMRRCYYCKKYLFRAFRELAVQKGLACVADGSNCDDEAWHRPGREAMAELGIRSPLKEAGLTKSDIRAILKSSHISAWDLPSQSCLLTRFPYGQEVTAFLLKRTASAEDFLKGLGFRQVRVRTCGNDVSIEVQAEQIPLFKGQLLKDTQRKFKQLGFQKITVDTFGYRTGSMDEKKAGHG